MKNKILIITVLTATLLLLATAFASADTYELRCLARGESINFGQLCNPDMPIVKGPTTLCVHHQDNGKQCNALLNICNSLKLKCDQTGGSGGGVGADGNAPALNLLSPLNNTMYNSKSIIFNVKLDESATISYTDLLTDRTIRICSDCEEFNRKKSFNEGTNKILVRAIDRNGNENSTYVTFFVDSKKPKIKSVIPKKGFVNGSFEVVFQEENPKKLTLYYGNIQSGNKNKDLNLATECSIEKSKTTCRTNVNIADYDGETIEYYFLLKDIANNEVESKRFNLEVDITKPKIDKIDTIIDRRKVEFLVKVTEKNFDEAQYMDDSGKWRKLCSNLKNGICYSKKTFTEGEHTVPIKVFDEAGNTDEKSVSFSL